MLSARQREGGSPSTATLGDHHRAADHIAGIRRHDRADVVVLQQFDGALGAAVRAGDEDDEIAVRLRGLDVVDPVGNASMERRGRAELKRLPDPGSLIPGP